MPSPRIDWSVIEPHYRAGLRALEDIGGEFGVSHTAIRKHANKVGWERDLKARIRAKADAKVSAAMVSELVSPETKATETMRVEIEAEVQARIRLAHRKDIGKYRALAMNMLAELDALGDGEKLAVRAKIIKDLTDVTKNLVALEREAYALADMAPPIVPDEIDVNDVARRLAFMFAGASRTIQ